MAGHLSTHAASFHSLGLSSLACPTTTTQLRASPPVVADGMPSYTAAREVVLVELAAGAVQHALTTRVALQQIAPQAKLTVLQAEWIPGAEPETP